MYGDSPTFIGHFDFDLSEVMYYLYLPVRMNRGISSIRLPRNVDPHKAQLDYVA